MTPSSSTLPIGTSTSTNITSASSAHAADDLDLTSTPITSSTTAADEPNYRPNRHSRSFTRHHTRGASMTTSMFDPTMDEKKHLSRRHDSLSTPLPSDVLAAQNLSDNAPLDPPPTPPQKPVPVSWMTLPRKSQLFILGLCRVFDFLQVASLQAYMFYQLKSFDETLPDSTISNQAGVLQGAFTAAQLATAIAWGRVADAHWGGRKFVLLFGLIGTSLSCIGVAFSTTFAWAVFFRAFGGAVNGTVGIIRTMIAENIKDKRFQSRAFLILPISFNVASLFGPVMGGMLADPVASYPNIFGPNSTFGGNDGVQWLKKYPYALPMLLNAFFLSTTAFAVRFGLEETLEARKGRPGIVAFLRRTVFNPLFSKVVPRSLQQYTRINESDAEMRTSFLNQHERDASSDDESYEMEEKAQPLRPRQKLPFSRIWTRNVICTLIAQAFFDFHMGAFNNIWLLFLSTPRYDPNSAGNTLIRSLPFKFTGGLGMLPQSVGFATAILGVIGMALQFSIYPSINARLGTVKSYQYSLLLFPIAYAIAPYMSVAPSSSSPPAQATGPFVWLSIVIVLLLQVTARTFSLPASIILLNNCSPHPSVLGTIHGIGQSVSSAFRTAGPVFGGAWYGWGLEVGVVGIAWWLMALVAALGCAAAVFVYEGSGHEIWLPGEVEED